jgi:hypothetical protein
MIGWGRCGAECLADPPNARQMEQPGGLTPTEAHMDLQDSERYVHVQTVQHAPSLHNPSPLPGCHKSCYNSMSSRHLRTSGSITSRAMKKIN